ncbi:MAG: PH domain-containing protein [Flavobacterium sp.]|jgi:Bacterial PH domain|uniref:PH domain-containing protein n=1 Tax=Flavobacterium TaxID=237 RepID=UPI0022CB8892|nr:PH domain-containing protein [Flavobacterium sp.]MCZ8089965.1 PH domain-containing protein [Flavobacterium sp.]MCZ8330535.1 PH domain-containing protein [Flavobacterium sp.]
MKIYKSKIDWWLIILILILFGYPIVDGILSKEYVLSLVFGLILIIFFFLSKTIQYKIDGENLVIWKTKIDIKTIRKIYRTNNPLSSPAMSLDRIAIVYNKFDEVLLSPKERDEFINELLKINPNIEVKRQ